MGIVKIEKRTNEPEAIQWTGKNLSEIYEFFSGSKFKFADSADITINFGEDVIPIGTWLLRGTGIPERMLSDEDFNKKYKIINN